MTTKTNTNPWLMDTRVRERNLKSGALTEKDLEKHLTALPDLEGQYDSFSTPQPALEQPRVAAPVVEEDEESESDLGAEAGEEEASTPDVGGGGGSNGGGGGGTEGGSEPTDGGVPA